MLFWFSPCKINLFLRVNGRIASGYHDLSTIMQTLDFGDYIVVEEAAEDVFSCSSEKIPLSQNLVVKARDLFREKTGHKSFYNIFLQKNIPLASGLGGGSSNAATTLFALNHMSGLEIEEKELQSWASNLGADVPFFFSSGHAVCRGAERLSIDDSIPIQHEHRFALIFPDVDGFFTQDVYQSLDLEKLADWEQDSVDHKTRRNDLETVALRNERFAMIKAEIEQALNSLEEDLFMSGSGPTLVSSLRNEEKVVQVLKDLGLYFVLATSVFRNPSVNQWFGITETSCAV